MGFYNTDNWPEKSRYYRWPWSSNDNPVGWLEITDACNIYCRGCYRKKLTGHRDLEVLKKEVDFFIRVRNVDTICIAGGEPLIYPSIVELVKYISGKGVKANIITNTHALTKELCTLLYKAGLYGFTCHIDMIQDRPGKQLGATEIDLMPLRQKIADLIFEVGRGKIYCTFNSTVYHENFKYLPDIVKWARKNVKKVAGLDFITYRGMPLKEGVSWAEVAEGESDNDIKEKLGYVENANLIDITSVDVYNLLKDNFGETYEPCAYLGGTSDVKGYKWWGGVYFMEKNGRVHGSLGPRTMEFMQITHHWSKRKYFMYLKRRNTLARFPLLLTYVLGDKAMKKVRRRLFLSLLNPINWFRPVYNQSIGINQPPDMMENGMSDMCESCPDACVWEGNLVSSCRLDEYRRYGKLLTAIVHEEDRNAVPGNGGKKTNGEPVVISRS
jgi:MoaA/NifB/PqqE/SkfB family radical SAM enzyme